MIGCDAKGGIEQRAAGGDQDESIRLFFVHVGRAA